MATDFLSIVSGSAVSSALTLIRGDLGVTLIIPASATPSDYRFQTATSSGASAAGDAFGDVQIQAPGATAATGLTPYTVASAGGGAAPVFVPLRDPLPTPFLRLRAVTTATLTSTFGILTNRVP